MILLFDMYGVIIKESGGITPYIAERRPDIDRNFLRETYVEASVGRYGNHEFFKKLGFGDPDHAMADYIERHLTFDSEFITFAEKFINTHAFALLSNDILDWSEYIRARYGIEKYFTESVVSANAGCRKPGRRIYEIILERLGVPADECVFIDDKAENLIPAEALGMHAVLFGRGGEQYDGDTVHDFDGLARLIESKYDNKTYARGVPSRKNL